MIIKKIVLSIILSLLFWMVRGQDAEQDSLHLALYQDINYMLHQGKHDKARESLIENEEYYKLHQLNLSPINLMWSRYYYYINDIDNFNDYSEKAYTNSLQTDEKLLKALGLYAKAFQSKVEGNHKETFQYLNQIEEIVELDDYPFLAYNIYYRYYSLYTTWEDLENTDYYTRKLIAVAKENDNFHQLADAYTARSFAMEYIFNSNHNEKYKDSIKFYREKAAYLDINHPDSVGMPTSSIAYLNLADYYTQGLENNEYSIQEVRDSIWKYTELADEVEAVFDPYYTIRGNVLNLRATLYKRDGKLEEAENHLLKAYKSLNDENVKEKPFYALKNVSGALYEFYTFIDDYKNANIYLEEYIKYNDSLFNLTKIREINELEAKYENDIVRDKNAYLENENRWKTIINYLLLTIILLACLVLHYIRKNSLKKLKLQKLKEKEILLEKEKVEAEVQDVKEEQAKLTEEQKALILEKSRLNKEALASNLQIERKDKLLQEIQDQIEKEKNIQQVRKTLKIESRISKSIDDSVNEFKNLPPEFFKKLKEKSNDKLTALDKKYCAYFYLGLATKEISSIFNVEDKSVRMTKYRIKQKLGLPKDQKLESFLSDL